MLHGFVCWTPLHIINMLNIQYHFLKGEEVIVFIYDDFSHHAELTQAVRENCPHIKIETIPQEAYGSKPVKLLRLFTNQNPFYQGRLDHLYLPGDTYFARILYANQIGNNPDLAVHYYEDGMGAYMGAEIIKHMNNFDDLQEKYNPKSLFHAKWATAFVYEPLLLQRQLAAQIRQLPKITEENPVFSLIKNIFAIAYDTSTVAITEPTIVYFDQPFQTDGSEIDEVAIYKELAGIAQTADLPIQVKMHPRSSKKKYDENVNYLETELPWEIYLLFTPVDRLILTGVNTTAAFSPYLLYGRKMPVVLLAHYVQRQAMGQVSPKTHQLIESSVQLVEQMQPIFAELLYTPTTDGQILAVFNEIKQSMKESN